MIRPFDLGDFFLLRRLQPRGVWLDPHCALAGGEPPAWTALSAPFRWWAGDAVTYVSREAGGGAIQMRVRPGRPEADIVFLAPALTGEEEIAVLWRRLLAYCAQQAGEQRVQRLFASLPQEAQEMLSLFAQMGFSPYTREEVYGIEPPAEPGPGPGAQQVRPLAATDGGALYQLYMAITPRLVQQAEGLGGPEDDVSLPGQIPGHWERFVLERDGAIAGLVLVQPGRSGHCLRLWGDFREVSEPLALLERGLAVLSAYPPRPIYCLVREYQSGVHIPLSERGFRPLATWSRLVKHTVVRVREPARRALPALEPRAEPSVPGAVPTSR